MVVIWLLIAVMLYLVGSLVFRLAMRHSNRSRKGPGALAIITTVLILLLVLRFGPRPGLIVMLAVVLVVLLLPTLVGYRHGLASVWRFFKNG